MLQQKNRLLELENRLKRSPKLKQKKQTGAFTFLSRGYTLNPEDYTWKKFKAKERIGLWEIIRSEWNLPKEDKSNAARATELFRMTRKYNENRGVQMDEWVLDAGDQIFIPSNTGAGTSTQNATVTFLLDPGHGGVINGVYQTPGKRSPVTDDGRQLFEGEFNRKVVAKIKAYCDQAGISYVDLPDSKKDISLSARVSKANELYAKRKSGEKMVLISVHANAHGNGENWTNAKGWEIYTTTGKTKSDDIATLIYKEMKLQFPNETYRLSSGDGDPDREKNFYIIHKSSMPAVLSENFFMTNKSDCENILMTDAGVTKIAKAHFNAMKKIHQNPGLYL